MFTYVRAKPDMQNELMDKVLWGPGWSKLDWK